MLQVVSVTFKELKLECHSRCKYDKVSLYDGSSANDPLLGRFCMFARRTITSSGPSLFIVFQTDYSVNKGGFSLNWTFVGHADEGWFIYYKCSMADRLE